MRAPFDPAYAPVGEVLCHQLWRFEARPEVRHLVATSPHLA